MEAKAAEAAKQSALRGLMDVARKRIVESAAPAVIAAIKAPEIPEVPELPAAPEIPSAPELPQAPEIPQAPEVPEELKLKPPVAAEKAALAQKELPKPGKKAPPPPPPRKGLILEPPNIGTLPAEKTNLPRGK